MLEVVQDDQELPVPQVTRPGAPPAAGPPESGSPMPWAIDEGTNPGSLTGASRTKYTPSG